MSVLVMAAHSPASIVNKFGLTPLGAYQPSSQKISPERLLSRRGEDLFQSEASDSQPAQPYQKQRYMRCIGALFSEQSLMTAEKLLSCRKVIYRRRRFPNLHTWRQGRRDPVLWKFSARRARKARSAYCQLRLLFSGIVLREGKGMLGRLCKDRVCCSPEQWERCCRQQA